MSCARLTATPAARLVWVAVACSAIGAAAAPVQPKAPDSGAIFSCIDDGGRRLTSDRPIPECANREQRVLNRDGSLRTVLKPSMTAQERAAAEERERQAAEAKAAQADNTRRDRNLMQRYKNEEAHRRARESALETARTAMRLSEQRLAELTRERKPLMEEAEFFKGREPPADLKLKVEANDTAVAAQRSAVQNLQAEIGRVSAQFDAELERLKQLWAGAAPGSLGPLVVRPVTETAAAPAAVTRR
jgi:hypothetical protein